MMNILHPTQVCPICPCWCFPVVQHMAPGSCRNEQQDVSSAALLGWWLLLRPTGSTAILISTLWFHLWGKISCIFPCFVLLGFFNCLAHYSQLIDPEECLSSGNVLSICTWIVQEAQAPLVCWLGSIGVHHHLCKRCLNLDLIWGWRCLYTPGLWYSGTWLHAGGWPFWSHHSLFLCRVLASPRVEKAIFPLNLEYCIIWHMEHSSCAWHRHLAQAEPQPGGLVWPQDS